MEKVRIPQNYFEGKRDLQPQKNIETYAARPLEVGHRTLHVG